ncbi:hypothetical protein R1sor_010948 [Riccia sorocarpa]|uniref:Endonuclease/exonuclease/phosphatase domain-containing protein n=1 Tax=Riccia sorocarpa TaxID=122646 RepID=A0ABD3HZH4_9MARC
MSSGVQVNISMLSVMPRATVVIDQKEDGKIDAALLLNKKLQVRARGCSGQGFAAWAEIDITVEEWVSWQFTHPVNEERTSFWPWLQQKIAGEQWLIIGDCNMVEHRNDTIGYSPLIRGGELWQWASCANSGDLVDDEMTHDGSSSLADYIPIKVKLVLQGESNNLIRKSYFKMYASQMKNPEVQQEIKAACEDHPVWVQDDRKMWGMTLVRVRTIMVKQKNRQRADIQEAEVIHAKLAATRLVVQDDLSEAGRIQFEKDLTEARRREQLDTRICRVRSRIKWLHEGDAPSRFFFACLRAKNAEENINTLKLESGEVVTEERRILKLIEESYVQLYTGRRRQTERGRNNSQLYR